MERASASGVFQVISATFAVMWSKAKQIRDIAG